MSFLYEFASAYQIWNFIQIGPPQRNYDVIFFQDGGCLSKFDEMFQFMAEILLLPVSILSFKFHRNRTKYGGIMTSCRFFKMAAGSRVKFCVRNIRPPTKWKCRAQLKLNFDLIGFLVSKVLQFLYITVCVHFSLKFPIYVVITVAHAQNQQQIQISTNRFIWLKFSIAITQPRSKPQRFLVLFWLCKRNLFSNKFRFGIRGDWFVFSTFNFQGRNFSDKGVYL